MQRPVYQYEVGRDDRSPVYIRLRVIHHGGPNATDEQRLRYLAAVCRQGVINSIAPIRPDWTNAQILDNVRGWLGATSAEDGHNNEAQGHEIAARNINDALFQGNFYTI
jgi:hypothetical protein